MINKMIQMSVFIFGRKPSKMALLGILDPIFQKNGPDPHVWKNNVI